MTKTGLLVCTAQVEDEKVLEAEQSTCEQHHVPLLQFITEGCDRSSELKG